jgi:hypothetical protein
VGDQEWRGILESVNKKWGNNVHIWVSNPHYTNFLTSPLYDTSATPQPSSSNLEGDSSRTVTLRVSVSMSDPLIGQQWQSLAEEHRKSKEDD